MDNWRWFEMAVYKAKAELKAEAARTYAGFFWWVLDPLLSMTIYYLVFAVVMKRGTDNFVGFLLIGIIFWRWFQGTVAQASNSILSSSGLINKVYLPKLVLPIVSVLTNMFRFFVVLVLLLILLWALGLGIGTAYFALPVLLVVQILLATGVSFIMAGIVPFMPDIRLALLHGLHLVFFMSGIFYSIEKISEPLRSILRINPMAGLIYNYRKILLHNEWPEWGYVFSVGIASIILISIGALVIRSYDRIYPKVC